MGSNLWSGFLLSEAGRDRHLCLPPDISFRASYLHPKRLDVVCAICPSGEVGQVELDLVPAVVQPHGHGADERFHARRALVVAGPKPPPYIFIIQHLKMQ